jgi:peroxiredoxin Q/BCP
MRAVSKLGVGGLALGVACLALSAGRAEEKKEVNVGDKAPGFEARDDQGNAWKLSDHVGKKYLVLYFFPADFTGGCTRQACAFRDEGSNLKGKDIEVIGISGDSAKNHELFKRLYKLNYTLLADEEGAVARKYGVPLRAGGEVKVTVDGKPYQEDGKDVFIKRGVTASRWTFVIGKDGKVIYKNTSVKPAEDAKQVQEVIAKQEKEGK